MVMVMRAATTMTPTLVAIAVATRAVSNRAIRWVASPYRLKIVRTVGHVWWKFGGECVLKVNFGMFNIKAENPVVWHPSFEEK
jgi:hypothetical protein